MAAFLHFSGAKSEVLVFRWGGAFCTATRVKIRRFEDRKTLN
jgi:hypothetical protein